MSLQDDENVATGLSPVSQGNHKEPAAIWQKPIPLRSFEQDIHSPDAAQSPETATRPPKILHREIAGRPVRHPAGYHAIKKCLEVQGPIKERSTAAKILGISPLTSESVSWYKGALGEIEIGERLDNMGPEWHIIHSMPIGSRGSDIDHIAIGRSGVFTINTKRHRQANVWVGGKSFMVNGQRMPYLRNSEFEAERVQNSLRAELRWDVPVSSVLAVQAKSLTIKNQPAPVIVVEGNWLNRKLKNRKKILSEEQYRQIVQVFELSDTWQIEYEDPAPLLADFAKLKKQEQQASLVKIIWLIGGAALAFWFIASNVTGISAFLMGF
ncbi:MAG: nuclease-related domain-containing protein [Microbacteriaceae bacterium]